MMPAKITAPGLLKIRVFSNNGYDVIIYVHDAINKIVSRDSNYIIDAVMWPKFRYCSISVRKVIITSILQGFDQKNCFFWGVVLVQVQWYETGTRYELEILHYCIISVKPKIQKVIGANFYVCRSYKEKTGREAFPPSPPPHPHHPE